MTFAIQSANERRPQRFKRAAAVAGIWLAWVLALTTTPRTEAHVGSPNVVFEGTAGSYPVRVVIKPPGVVPGLAEITVRSLEGPLPKEVTVLPVHWRAGLEGAPPPDVARPVRGEPRLFTAALWLMDSGAYSVHVQVSGDQDSGKVIVPVASTALEPLKMDRGLGWMLGGFGLLLIVLMASILGAAVREGMLEGGRVPTRGWRWLGWGVQGLLLLGLGLAVYGGNQWWAGVDSEYRTRRLFEPMRLETSVRDQGGVRILNLRIEHPKLGPNRWTPLVPDHGKLMHLFMVREPGLDAFAHAHPVQREGRDREFELRLPPLPPGDYRLYADITQESGLAQTLTGTVSLAEPGTQSQSATPDPGSAPVWSDPEDSWHVSAPVGVDEIGRGSGKTQPLGDHWTMTRLDDEDLRAGRDVKLRFAVTDDQGRPVRLVPFMGMFSHAALSRLDGTVFNHLHPLGTISMAAQQVMQLRAQGKSPAIVTAEALEAFCKDPPESQSLLPLEFPCWFPEPGRYRMWVQVKPAGATRATAGVFDLEVADAAD